MAEVNATQMRDALAWATDDAEPDEPSKNPFVWFWEAIEGDFNESRSTSQILVDAGISMIPLVDQLCDLRDLIANCRKLSQNHTDVWNWVALVLTLIGLFPALGSLVKGVLKIFFGFVRRSGADKITEGVEAAMSWIISFLRRRKVQEYLKAHKVDEVLKWLATEIKAVRAKINVGELTAAFDRTIKVVEVMANKVELVPILGSKAKQALVEVKRIRMQADKYFAEALKPVQHVVDSAIMKLEREALQQQKGIVDVRNVHFRGTLPEAKAVSLMRNARTRPTWLSDGASLRWAQAKVASARPVVAAKVKDGWPNLTDGNIQSFHKLASAEIKGPERLYRILSPNSRAMSDCWVSEKVFNDIQNSSDPRAAWRKFLAVWPDWNANGQFVIYDIKPGESLKVWRGPASGQTKEFLPDAHLEGGWEQIVFNVARTDSRNDVVRFYKLKGGQKNILQQAISQTEFNKLSDVQKKEYVSIRETITHPNISGPFETGWGYTDFEGAGFAGKIGLPNLPGQSTVLQK
ncbi:hypothetical protein [Massilia suwonensis]|uniref:Uncharacterized protein n=1 Tax=Massilia suwonensis TaxID=648895 RepID=A0ABW0MII0_9BURK